MTVAEILAQNPLAFSLIGLGSLLLVIALWGASRSPRS